MEIVFIEAEKVVYQPVLQLASFNSSLWIFFSNFHIVLGGHLIYYF